MRECGNEALLQLLPHIRMISVVGRASQRKGREEVVVTAVSWLKLCFLDSKFVLVSQAASSNFASFSYITHFPGSRVDARVKRITLNPNIFIGGSFPPTTPTQLAV